MHMAWDVQLRLIMGFLLATALGTTSVHLPSISVDLRQPGYLGPLLNELWLLPTKEFLLCSKSGGRATVVTYIATSTGTV